jgi:hypothetical protein
MRNSLNGYVWILQNCTRNPFFLMTKTKSGIREMCSEVSCFINKLDRAWHNLLQKELNSSATKLTVPKYAAKTRLYGVTIVWICLLHPWTYFLTYLRSWALLEELSIVQPLKNPPAFYATRRFNTVFTRLYITIIHKKRKIFISAQGRWNKVAVGTWLYYSPSKKFGMSCSTDFDGWKFCALKSSPEWL